MSTDLARLLSLVAAGAVLPIVHVAVALRLFRAAHLSWPWRLSAWIPPWTLVVALRARAPLAASLWVLTASLYAMARAVATL